MAMKAKMANGNDENNTNDDNPGNSGNDGNGGNDASDDNHGNGGNRKEVEVGWISTRNANCGFAWSSTQPN